MPAHLTTISLEVSNVEVSQRFYTGIFEMTVDLDRSEPSTFIYLMSAGVAITLARVANGQSPQPSSTMELGFELADIDGLRARLENFGVKCIERRMSWGMTIELSDPDGYHIVCYQFTN
ncbi:MAG: VOC family protein [Kofleriaceae bacterium]